MQLYGYPSKYLLEYSLKISKETPPAEQENTIPASRIKEKIETVLRENKLIGWKVELSDKRLTTVYSAENKIGVGRDRVVSEAELARICIHEVLGHVFRCANGYAQPLKIMGLGLPGYLDTEEGLASFLEEKTGTLSTERLRDCALRVVAVDSVMKGKDFRKTFDIMKTEGLSDDQAWDLTFRVFRGGGYIKDHIYLQGLVKIRKFAEEDGDFKTLYAGAIGLDDLTLVRNLLKKGILRPPVYFPKILETE
ncbi:MAG: tyrosine/phenylalanine carboxypeptidase domain-containing protein [Candidatus Woesearchaeota archaeon]